MLLLIFSLVLQGYNKMKPCKVSYQSIKQKMKFGNQELPVPTNEFHYPGREAVNDKFNCLIDNIRNIPKHTNNNEQFVCLVKKGIICALYNFCIADNQGVLLLTKASPSRKGYTTFVLLSGPYKGVYTNFKDLYLAKEGIQSPIYKGLYSREEAEKTLELNTTNINKIKKALEPQNMTIVINADQTKTNHKTYKDSISPNIPGPINGLNLDNFKKIQNLLLFKVHNNQTKFQDST